MNATLKISRYVPYYEREDTSECTWYEIRDNCGTHLRIEQNYYRERPDDGPIERTRVRRAQVADLIGEVESWIDMKLKDQDGVHDRNLDKLNDIISRYHATWNTEKDFDRLISLDDICDELSEICAVDHNLLYDILEGMKYEDVEDDDDDEDE